MLVQDGRFNLLHLYSVHPLGAVSHRAVPHDTELRRTAPRVVNVY